MTNINRTPQQAMASNAKKADDDLQPCTLRESNGPQVADLHILSVWNEHRARLNRTQVHLL